MYDTYVLWKGGRAVYCNGLENRRTERYREFESHPFRQNFGKMAERPKALGC